MKRSLVSVLLAALVCAHPAPLAAVPWASLKFGAATTDRVDLGHAASITDLGLSAFSIVMWVDVTTLTNNRGIFGSAVNNSGNPGSAITIRLTGTAGNVAVILKSSAGTNVRNYSTSDTPLATVNQWNFLAVTYDSALGSNMGHIYAGTVTASPTLRTLGTNTESGTVSAETGATTTWANYPGLSGAFSVALQGDVALGQIYNRALDLGELSQLWRNPHPLRGCVAYSLLGAGGTGRVTDLSGQRNDGTITGAIPTNNFVPQLARALRLIRPT